MRPLALHAERSIAFAASIALVLFTWAGAPAHAREPARWIELRTPHFTVVSNTGEDDARRIALQFERVRTWLERAHTDARFDAREPIVVLAVGDENGLRELLPQFWERKAQRPVAAYWRGPYRQCIALRIDAPDHERYRRVLHEYVHLLTHATVPDLPVWLDEGVSEFWNTAIVHDDAVEVGRPAAQHLRLLQSQRRWIPVEELLAMERVPDARDKQKLSLFYAQSWAIVHYLMLGGETMRLQFAPAGELPPPSELESAVAAYVSGGRFRTIRIEAPDSDGSAKGFGSAEAFALRTLAPATSLAIRAGCLAEGERPAAALPLLARALADNPDDATVLETLGYVHFEQNEPAEAAKWFDRAIASASPGHLAYFYRSILAGPVPATSDGTPVSAEDYLRRSIDLAPEFAPAYVRLADLFASQRGREGDALPLLQRASALDPENPSSWVHLGRLFVSLNRPSDARRAGEKAFAVARSASSRNLAAAFLRELSR